MGEIFRQLPSREIPDMARLACGMEGCTQQTRRECGRDETELAHETCLSLASSCERASRSVHHKYLFFTIKPRLSSSRRCHRPVSCEFSNLFLLHYPILQTTVWLPALPLTLHLLHLYTTITASSLLTHPPANMRFSYALVALIGAAHAMV